MRRDILNTENIVITNLIIATEKRQIHWEKKEDIDECIEYFEGLYSNIESIFHTEIDSEEYLIINFYTEIGLNSELLIFDGSFMKVPFKTVISNPKLLSSILDKIPK